VEFDMKVQFKTALLFVNDVKSSRDFYEKVLNQKVVYDFGEDVVFDGGFAIHDADHISVLLFNRPNPNTVGELGKENFELYFETDELDEACSRVAKSGAAIIHDVMEQPWGQRVMRFYDPDHHIVEIGEPMTAVIRRYLGKGMSAAEAARKTSMPIEEVLKVKSEIGEMGLHPMIE
jgi:catechol 2,3-dioxygenase-like lactoylglutathione lyase family enzyme